MRILAFATLLLLTACNPADPRVAQIQQIAQTTCQFLPTASSIAQVLADPTITVPASQIAQLICDQVKSSAQALMPEVGAKKQVCFELNGKTYCVEGEKQ